MIFERAPFLLLLQVPLLWAVWEWRRTRRKAALVLKALTLAMIAAALSGPSMQINESKLALAVLVDTSHSIPGPDLASASSLVSSIEKSRGTHAVRVLSFARAVRPVANSETAAGWRLGHTSGEGGRATDLEAAIREGIATMPADRVPRLVLISDGNENAGTVTRAAWQARQLGIPIDTIALGGRPRPELRLESAALPAEAFTGEPFPIELTVTSPQRVPATVELSAEGKVLGSSAVTLEPGTNQVRLHANLATPGALNVTAVLRARELGELRFDQAVNFRKPRLIYVSSDPPDSESHLLNTLAAAQFAVDRSSDALSPNLGDYQVAVFNNWDLESLPRKRKEDIENFVKQGGGLLVIGGEHNVYDDKKKTEDALDRALPAKLAPPRSPEGTCVVLIIDKSSSMEGKKIELARQAATGVIDNLRPIDTVGVLIFDNSFQWAVPLRRAEDRGLIKRLVAGITPDGGTQIAPALTEAYRKVLPAKATFKHIVLLTDGISEEGDSLELSKEAALQRVTISTVGLGQDVNRSYLEKVASFAKGKSHFLNDPEGLEQILLKDVMEHTGTTTVEKPLRAAVAKKVEILDQTGIESAPELHGYVRFIAKPSADTVLLIDEKEPLLTRWQYGLGRSVIFASDAKTRWAADWVSWKGFDKFWTNLCRDLLPHAQPSEAKADYDSARGDLAVQYRLSPEAQEPKTVPAIYVIGPSGFQKPLPLTKVAEREYRGRVPLGGRQGLFRIRPVTELRAFPEIGFYRQEQELRDYGSNEMLLRSVASFTGGRFNPNVKQLFDSGGRTVTSTLRLWPGLLAIAILLDLIELMLRKQIGSLASIRALFGRGHRPAVAPV